MTASMAVMVFCTAEVWLATRLGPTSTTLRAPSASGARSIRLSNIGIMSRVTTGLLSPEIAGRADTGETRHHHQRAPTLAGDQSNQEDDASHALNLRPHRESPFAGGAAIPR